MKKLILAGAVCALALSGVQNTNAMQPDREGNWHEQRGQQAVASQERLASINQIIANIPDQATREALAALIGHLQVDAAERATRWGHHPHGGHRGHHGGFGHHRHHHQ